MFYSTILLFGILLAVHVTACPGTTPVGPKKSNVRFSSNKSNLQANHKASDVKSPNPERDSSIEWWRRLMDKLSHGEFSQLFLETAPSLNQAVLTTVFSWARQRIVSPASRAFASHLATLLPPPPQKCPINPRPPVSNVLPTEEEIFEHLFNRENFTSDESGASLLLTAFAQHTLFQFSSGENTSFVFDASQIYGSNGVREMELRTGREGRLKMQNGFPPSVSEAAVDMMYPSDKQRTLRYFHLTGATGSTVAKSTKWALGHALLGATPLDLAVSTLWLREHNRLCDQMVARHPNWSDQRLFDAVRGIVIGKMILISLREILPRLAGIDVLAFDKAFTEEPKEQNEIPPWTSDLTSGLLWAWQLPDTFKYGDTEYLLSDILFTDHQHFFKHGLAAIFDSLSRQPAGKVMSHNHAHALKGWTKRLIRQSRRAAAPSFNSYRHLVGLPLITSFHELTDESRTVNQLKMLYGREDALELYPGLVIEKTEGYAVLPPTLLRLLASGLHEAIEMSPIGPPCTWEDNIDSFGDAAGLEEVRSASILGLLRQNGCGACRASLDVPHPEEKLSNATCAFSFRPDRLSAAVVCSLMKERSVGFSFRANIFSVS